MEINNEIINKIKDILENTIKAELTYEIGSTKDEEILFTSIVDFLDESLSTEFTTIQISGINVEQITSPLWDVIITLLDLVYGSKIVSIIQWYLFERYDIENDSYNQYYINELNKKIKIKNSKDLWKQAKKYLN
jgi:hypothetical protein